MKTLLRLVAFLIPVLCFGSITSTTDKSATVVITGLPQVIPTTIYFQASADLRVLDIGSTGTPIDPATVLTLGSDYTVTGGGYNSATQMQTGSITVVSTGSHSVAVGHRIVILRNVTINQTTSFATTGPLTIAQIEQAIDKQATLNQQNAEVGGRSLQFENFETLSPTLSLASRKGMVLGFDATTGAVSYVPSSSLGATLVTQILAGTNISLSPVGGTGAVTVTGTGGSVGTGTLGALGYYAGVGTALSPTNAAGFGATFGSGELFLYSNDTTATRLTLSDTSSGGVSWYLTSGGSGANTAGAFGIADFTSPGSPPYLSIAKTTGKTTFVAPTTSKASINLPHGTAPTSPVNGDLWSTTAGVFGYVNGSTVGPFGAGGGGSGTVNAGTAGQSAWYPTSTNAVSGTSFQTFGTTSGEATFTPTARSGATVPMFKFNTVTDLAMTAATESIAGQIGSGNTRQFASNTALTTQREFVITAPAYAFVTPTGTITNAATLAITGGPAVSTNAAITNPFALWLQSGNLGLGAAGSIYSIAPSSGGIIGTAASTGTVQLNQTAAGGLTINNTSTTPPYVLFSKSGVTQGLVGTVNTASDLITGGLAGELGIRGGASGIAFSADNGSSVAARFVVTTGQLSLLKAISASTSLTGTLIIGNGSAATNVGIGGGNINAGGTLTAGGLVDISASTAGQIKFPATQNASANANTLDDYAEGTWTPSLGGSATYTAQTGTYTKIGRQVTINGRIAVNAIGTGSTTIISGAPFSAGTGHAAVTIGPFVSAAGSYVFVTGLIASGGTGITVYSLTAAGTTAGTNPFFGSGTDVYFSATYSN